MTHVLAEGYYPWFEVLNKSHWSKNIPLILQENALADSNDETCAMVHAPGFRTLQAIFNFPAYNVTNQIAVDVVTKAAEDCSSQTWTWFVGSNCSSNRFRECNSVGIDKHGVYSSCRVTCACLEFEYCKFLHFKYTLNQNADNVTSALCEVNLVYGDVILPYHGTGWIDPVEISYLVAQWYTVAHFYKPMPPIISYDV